MAVDPLAILFYDLNSAMVQADFVGLRNLVNNAIPPAKLQNLQDPTAIFHELQNNGKISKRNLEYLKNLFSTMGKQPLVDRIKEYEDKMRLPVLTDPQTDVTTGSQVSGNNQKATYTDVTGTRTQSKPLHQTGATDVQVKGVGGNIGKSVLILNDEWGTSKGGISTIHRQIAIQAKNAGFDVHVTTLQTPSPEDQLDAKKKGIHIVEAHKEGKLDLDCINITHKTYFPDEILSEINPDVIIGHIPVTTKGAHAIGKKRLGGKRVFQFAHTIPEDTDPFKDGSHPRATDAKGDSIIEFAMRSDACFAIGPRIYNHYDGRLHNLGKKVVEYIPYPDEGFFNLDVSPPKLNHPVRILAFGRVDNVGRLKGYDIITEALSKVCDDKKDNPPKLDIRGVPDDKHEETKDFFKEYKTSEHLQIIFHPYESQTRIMKDLQQSHLVIMPSRSEPFGMVAMEAIAAGIPVLITKHSGLAEFMKANFGLAGKEMVVDVGLDDTKRQKDVNEWYRRITEMLEPQYIRDRFIKAGEIKEKLKSLKTENENDNKYIRMLKGELQQSDY